MSNESLGRGRVMQRLAGAFVLVSSLSGCLSHVSTSIRETPGAPVQRLRLIRADLLPIAGTFKQEGHAVVGQLTLTGACNAESYQRVKRQSVTERHTDRPGAIGWLIAGSIITAVGVGVLAESVDANQQVTCGQGRAGDRCESEASTLQELGITTLVTGILTAATGTVFLALKPQIEAKELPDTETAKVTSRGVACAPTSGLEGVVVAIEIPGNGTWTGHSTADGAVRIDVQPTIPMPEGTKVQVVVQSSPSTFAASARPGTVIGEVTFEKPQPSSPLPTARKLSKR